MIGISYPEVFNSRPPEYVVGEYWEYEQFDLEDATKVTTNMVLPKFSDANRHTKESSVTCSSRFVRSVAFNKNKWQQIP
jgi:hypothetical protein